MKYKIKLKYGSSCFNFPLSKWKNTKVVIPKKHKTLGNFRKAILNAINHPIGTRPLKELLKGKNSIAIVIPDSTRKARCDEYLPVLIKEINKAGINNKNIKIIVANGTHTLKAKKINNKIIGNDIPKDIKIIDHDCDDDGNLVYIGETSRKNEVHINKAFWDADFKIITGVIGFHYFAGFNGGRKAILPGIAARKTIEFNHKLFLGQDRGFNKNVKIGKLKGNPLHEDMLEAAKLANVNFMLNFVFDEKIKLMGVFCGDLQKAHEAGAKFVDKNFRIMQKQLADVVVVSCGGHPKDINFVQTHKSIENASYILKEGGTMICLAECSDALGSPTLYDWFQYKDIDELEKKLRENYRMNGHTALSLLMKAEKFKIIFVTKMNKDIVRKMKMIPADSLDEALAKADIKKPDKIVVILEGSTTLVMI